jgi:hypothetical protein
MKTIVLLVAFCLADAFHFSPFFNRIYWNQRTRLFSEKNESESPSSSNIVWEEGEVPWEIEQIKNITLQPVKMSPTPFLQHNDNDF